MKKTMIAIASLLLLSGTCWSDDMEANSNEVKYYDNAKVVRIKSVEGEGFVQRSYEEGNEEATANLPLFEKDTVGTTDGRLAIYLGRLNYLRLDADSIVVLEKIPQLRKTDLNVRLEQGSLYLDIGSLDQEKGIEIQTADCGIFLLDKGLYRVNVNPQGRSEVIVLEGIAEVAGSESSRNVRENQMIVMERGEVSERPFYFSAADKDEFDRWNEAQNRELGYARYGTSRYLQSGYEDYEYEMSRAGRWSYMSDFNSYAWIPYYANSDWRPYDNGRWVWNPYYGYVWVSYDTCGWFTHHYGRWHWSYNLGWCWIPSYHWSPAWVSWFGDNHYYGWCPLSWWNRPIIIINNHWDRNYNYHRGIPHNSRSTIIIRKNEISAANIHRIALRQNALDQESNGAISYRGTAPSDRPAVNKVTVINADGKAMIFKQNGIVSTDKYRAQGSDIHSAVYKYNPADNGAGASRSYRKKVSSGSATTGSTTVNKSRTGEGASGSTPAYKSRTGEEAGSTSRARYSPSSAKAEKSTGKTSYRSKTDGAAKATSSTSSSTSTSSSSSGTVKKKKGGVSYFSSTGGENSSVRNTAATTQRYQSRYTSGGDEGSRYAYRSTLSNFRASSSGERAAAGTTDSSPSYNYRSGSYEAGGRSSYRPAASSTSYSHEYKASSSGGSYSASAGSRSSGSSGSYRASTSSSGSSHVSRSSSSSGSSNRTAVKKH